MRSALQQIVPLLVAGQLEDIERIDRGGRMKADEWRAGIAEYGRTLTQPPDEDFASADVTRLAHSGKTAWSVWYRLWTEEEGKSDLLLQLTVYAGDPLEIEADDLRVV